MKKLNLDAVEESKGGFERPGAGAYVMKVISAEDKEDKEYVLLYMDYAEGEFKNYGENTEARSGQDFGYMKAYLSYKETAKGFLKHNIKIMDTDNPKKNIYSRFNDGDFSCLKGAFVCVVVGEQEYQKNDGTIGTSLTLPTFIPAADLRAKKYKVPPLKKLAITEPAAVVEAPKQEEVSFDDIPF